MEIKKNAIYTYAQLKTLLGSDKPLSRVAAEKLIKSGELKPLRIGKGYIFTGKSILEFLEKRQKGALSA